MKFAFLALGALVASIAPTAVTAAKSWDVRHIVVDYVPGKKMGWLVCDVVTVFMR